MPRNIMLAAVLLGMASIDEATAAAPYNEPALGILEMNAAKAIKKIGTGGKKTPFEINPNALPADTIRWLPAIGVLVLKLDKEGSYARAGGETLDAIVKIDRVSINKPAELNAWAVRSVPGKEYVFEIRRQEGGAPAWQRKLLRVRPVAVAPERRRPAAQEDQAPKAQDKKEAKEKPAAVEGR